MIENNFENQYFNVLDKILSENKLKTSNRIFFEKVLNYADDDFKCSTPWTVSWKVVSACNLRCKHCYFKKDDNDTLYNSENDLNSQEIIELAKDLTTKFGIVNYSLTGGEPLLRKDIFDIIKVIKNANGIVSLQTNGTLITDSIANKLADVLNPNTDFVQISLDGLEKKYNEIRGNGNFVKAINGIKTLISRGIKVNVNCTPVENNLNEIIDLYKYCSNIHINKFSLSRFIPFTEKQKLLEPNINKLISVMSDVIELSKISNTFLEINYRFFDFVSNEELRAFADKYIIEKKIKNQLTYDNVNCHKHNTLFIDTDGSFYLCFSSKQKNKGLGSCREKSIEKIWKNRTSNIFFKNRNKKDMICNKCKYFAICKGGCPASAYNKYENINYPDGLCKYAKSLIKN